MRYLPQIKARNPATSLGMDAVSDVGGGIRIFHFAFIISTLHIPTHTLGSVWRESAEIEGGMGR